MKAHTANRSLAKMRVQCLNETLRLVSSSVLADRVNFERVLFEVFEISKQYESIKSSLLHPYRIRIAVKTN